jgi:uncharacterized protein YjiS (DUF1127 family)
MQTQAHAITIGDRLSQAVDAAVGVAGRRITGALAVLRGEAARQRDLRMLREFDAHLLADMGLTRSEVGRQPRDFILWW